MLVHPSPRTKCGTLVNALRHHTKDKLSWKAGPDKLGIVHRLDRDTSGVMVAAKTDIAYDSLKAQFMEHSNKRIYNAIVCGNPPHPRTLEIPVGKHDDVFDKMDVKYFYSKDATTHMNILEKYYKFSLLELELETGRTHQIRLHLSHIGYPIVGDYKYGGKKVAIRLASFNKNLCECVYKLRRQALHAKLLGIVHPTKREYMEFTSEIPDDMMNIIDVLCYLKKKHQSEK